MKTVLITGGSRGIGEAMVRLYAEQGWRVAFTYLHSEERALALRRETGALAFVGVKLYGKADKAAYQRFTAEATRILGDVLSVPADGVYVEYEETDHWGWNGSNF